MSREIFSMPENSENSKNPENPENSEHENLSLLEKLEKLEKLKKTENALNEIDSTLHEMLLLAEISAQDMDMDRDALQKTLEHLRDKIDRIADTMEPD